jgi:D-3-phosphoglycerate dehydrogenase
MTARPYQVYVVPGRGQRDYADTQAALAHVPARVTMLSFIGDEAGMIAATRDADALIIAASPVTRGVMSALEGLKVVVRTGVGYDVVDVPAATELGVAVVNARDRCTGRSSASWASATSAAPSRAAWPRSRRR